MTSRRASLPDPTTQAILEHWRESAPRDRLAHLVRDAARGFTRGLQLRLSRHAISFGHWVFLRILWEGDGLTQRDLSVMAGLMEPTTHSAILRMEELGYVERRRRPGNRKKIFVFLTEEGRALKSALVPLAEEVNAVAVQGVSRADIEATRRTLLAIIQNMADDEVQAVQNGQRIISTRALAKKTRTSETRRKRAG
jgi:DNA-binding MarR family transcriptional regulator